MRVIGNFAAHPIKSTNTGEVVAVEPGEAEFLLDVLDGVFGFYFVQPEVARKQREAINIKLQEAGKPRLRPSGRVAKPSGPRRKGVRTAGFLFRLETPEGEPAEPPRLSAAVPNAKVGDTIPLWGRTLRVVGKRDDEADEPLVLIVEAAS